VTLNSNGKIVAGKARRVRGFETATGRPTGLLFPAKPVIVRRRNLRHQPYIRSEGLKETTPREDVKLWTISKMRLPALASGRLRSNRKTPSGFLLPKGTSCGSRYPSNVPRAPYSLLQGGAFTPYADTINRLITDEPTSP